MLTQAELERRYLRARQAEDKVTRKLAKVAEQLIWWQARRKRYEKRLGAAHVRSIVNRLTLTHTQE